VEHSSRPKSRRYLNFLEVVQLKGIEMFAATRIVSFIAVNLQYLLDFKNDVGESCVATVLA
jgi:hypothetical protein